MIDGWDGDASAVKQQPTRYHEEFFMYPETSSLVNRLVY